MNWLRKWDTLPQEVRQLILHNGTDTTIVESSSSTSSSS